MLVVECYMFQNLITHNITVVFWILIIHNIIIYCIHTVKRKYKYIY